MKKDKSLSGISVSLRGAPLAALLHVIAIAKNGVATTENRINRDMFQCKAKEEGLKACEEDKQIVMGLSRTLGREIARQQVKKGRAMQKRMQEKYPGMRPRRQKSIRRSPTKDALSSSDGITSV